MDKQKLSVKPNTDDTAAIDSAIVEIEQLLNDGKSLDEILQLDAAAAGGQGGTGSSVANAVRFLLNADQVIPLAGFNTHAADITSVGDQTDELSADTEVDAQLSIQIVDGGDGLLNRVEINSVVLQGHASGFEGPPGSLLQIEILNQDGISFKTSVVTDSQGQYRTSVDLSQYQHGDQLTATVILNDTAGNQLSNQDSSLVDLHVDGNLSLEIEDGGDGYLNASEQSEVVLSGLYQGLESIADNQVQLVIRDNNGLEIRVETTVDEQGRYQRTVDLSEFSGRVTAIATAFDVSGNTIDAEDQSQIDSGVDGELSLTIEDGGDERLNAQELTAVKIFGQVDSTEVQEGDTIKITLNDQSGNQIEQNTTIDGDGYYEITLDLSHFQHGDVLEAQSQISDPAGNQLSARDTSQIDALFEAQLSVNIADGGDSIINIGDANNTIINGRINTEEGYSPTIQLIIEDQSGGRIDRQVGVQNDGQYSLSVDFSVLQQGDLVNVSATAVDAAGNFLNAADTSTLEAQIIIPILQANNDQDEFHGQLINGNVLTGNGADVFTGPVNVNSISYRGIDIDLTTAVAAQSTATNNGQQIVYSVSNNGQLTLSNLSDLSVLIFNRSGQYQFQAGTQNIDQHESIGYTLSDSFGQSDSALLNLIIPTNNPDTLTGTNADDHLFGLDGNDTISGLDGNDNIEGGVGWDILHGNDGDDTIAGENGFDQLFGGEGNDTLNAGNGKDKAFGGEGDDNIDGGSWDDLIDGGNGNDTLIGNTGMDIILGGNGNDNIDGGRWDDSISGGSGDDIIRGGRGLDVIDGGAGNDVFVFSQTDNLSSSSTNQDTIYNFDTTEDRINLSDLLVNFDPAAGDDILDFLDIQFSSVDQMLPNTDHMNSIEGNVRPTLNNGFTDTVIRIDIDGDGSFNGNTQEIVLADLDLSHLGNTEAEIIQALLNGGILSFD